jgi:hypothetical protein
MWTEAVARAQLFGKVLGREEEVEEGEPIADATGLLEGYLERLASGLGMELAEMDGGVGQLALIAQVHAQISVLGGLFPYGAVFNTQGKAVR